MAALVAVDWGSSSFRAAQLDASGRILAELATDQGVTKLTGDQCEAYLVQQIGRWLGANPQVPLILCGMVGSGLGWREVPYLNAPLSLPTLAEHLMPVSGTHLSAWIVPGVMGESVWGEPDVMRGEETQILGWLAQCAERAEETVLCMPGTHTKWAFLQGDTLQQLSTAFSGELFALLSEASMLVRGEQQFSQEEFLRGVERSANKDALNHILFSVRSRVLTGQLAAHHAESYLSGLIIGAEVAGFREHLAGDIPVEIIGSAELACAYKTVLEYHDIGCRKHDGAALSFAGLFHLSEKLIR